MYAGVEDMMTLIFAATTPGRAIMSAAPRMLPVVMMPVFDARPRMQEVDDFDGMMIYI